MSKRRQARGQQRMLWTLSAVTVAAMLCGTVTMLRPPRAPQPTPQPPTATAAPPTAVPAPSVTPAAESEVGAEEFSFAVAGDSRGGDDVFREILRRVSDEGLAFLVHTGDLVTNGTEAEFHSVQAMLQELTVPFYPVPGNHDGGSALDSYLQYSGAPAAHYSFDRGQAHLAFVDSHTGSLSAEELAWLDADLAGTAQPLRIVLLHHPPFGPDSSGHIMSAGNEAFMQLMEQRGVQYVFCGHIHAYAALERNGVQYVITGGAGAPLQLSEALGGYYHYLRVHVQGSELSYEVVRVAETSWVPGQVVCIGVPSWV